MFALFMLAIHALWRALANLLPGAAFDCRAPRTGMIAAVPGKSPDPVLGLPLALHARGAASRRGGGEYGPAPP